MDVILRLTDDESRTAVADLIARALGGAQPSAPTPEAKPADPFAYVVATMAVDGALSDVLGVFGSRDDAQAACSRACNRTNEPARLMIVPTLVNALRTAGGPLDGAWRA